MESHYIILSKQNLLIKLFQTNRTSEWPTGRPNTSASDSKDYNGQNEKNNAQQKKS